MNKHFKIVAMLHVVFGAVTLWSLAAAAWADRTIRTMSEMLMADRTAPHESRVVVDLLLGALPLLFVVQIAGGWGLWKGKAWARPVLITMGILCLLAFPWGTALGLYTLWVLLAPQALCDDCLTQPATVIVIRITNGDETRQRLCQACSEKLMQHPT